MADDLDKSEEPTPKKLEDARKKGDVAQSKEFASFVVFAGLLMAMYFFGDFMLDKVLHVLRDAFTIKKGLIHNEQEFWLHFGDTLKSILIIVAPLFIAVWFFGIAGFVGQFGLLFTGEKLKPDFKKISPLKGIKKIFSKDTAVELVKSVVKVGSLSFILYFIFEGKIDDMISAGIDSVPSIFMFMMELIGQMSLAVLVFLAFLGVIDFSYQKWSFQQKQKMSNQEVKDENKQREGDPHVKARIRQVQREMNRARMMQEVPDADVVVANPTHVAVAIKYKRGEMNAPVVVAKGADHLALKIKILAVQSGVPVLEKKQLARYLYRNIEVGHPVPESLYSAVAEVLAYIYRMKKKYKSLGGWTGDAQPVLNV